MFSGPPRRAIDVTWQLFPIHGSDHDPGVTAAIEAAGAARVIVGWGPRTPARDRFGAAGAPTPRRASPG